MEPGYRRIYPGTWLQKDISWNLDIEGYILEPGYRRIYPETWIQKDVSWNLDKEGYILEPGYRRIYRGTRIQKDLFWIKKYLSYNLDISTSTKKNGNHKTSKKRIFHGTSYILFKGLEQITDLNKFLPQIPKSSNPYIFATFQCKPVIFSLFDLTEKLTRSHAVVVALID